MIEIKEEPSNVEWTREMADSCQPSDIVRFGIRAVYNQGYHDAIEAYRTMLELEKEECDEQVSCTECEHYDKEKHYCPRFCSVIRDAVRESEEPAEWILLDECSNSGYYCSKCHKKVIKEGWSDTVKKVKYCPNCGRRMQSED